MQSKNRKIQISDIRILDSNITDDKFICLKPNEGRDMTKEKLEHFRTEGEFFSKHFFVALKTAINI